MSGTRDESSADLFRWQARTDLWVFVRLPRGASDGIAAVPRARAGSGAVTVLASVGGQRWSTSVFSEHAGGCCVLALPEAVARRRGGAGRHHAGRRRDPRRLSARAGPRAGPRARPRALAARVGEGGPVQDYSPRGTTGPCVFCRIVAGELPAELVHRSPRLVAFLDAHPLFPGHVLLVPRVHVQTWDELPAELAGEWVATSQALQRAVEAATGSEGALLIVNNVVSQSVPHLHAHHIPRRRGDGLARWLGPRQRYAPGQAAEVAQAVRDALADQGVLPGQPVAGAGSEAAVTPA